MRDGAGSVGSRPPLSTGESTRTLAAADWQAIESVIGALAVHGRAPVSALPANLDLHRLFIGCRELALPVRRDLDDLVWQPSIDLLDADRIRSYTGPSNQSCRIEVSPLVDSTNERLKSSLLAGAWPSAVFAEAQWAGRGRRERRWCSRFGESVMLSLRVATGRPVAELPGMAIAAGVAIARCLIDQGARGIGLKWPNDVLLDGAKVGGILVEAVTPVARQGTATGVVVIGVGVNWQSPDEGGLELRQPAAGLAGQVDGGRQALAGHLLAALLDAARRFGSEGIAPFLDGFEELDQLAGEAVVVEERGSHHIGIARGLTEDGALRVEHVDGQRVHHSAEVSLRRLSASSLARPWSPPLPLDVETSADR